MGSDVTDTVTQAAMELYGLAPDGFIAARNARAKAAAAEGNRELADRIRHLPKPSAPAWAIDALARAEPGMITDLLELRERFSQAQETGDRAQLRALDSQRHETISAAVSRARALAATAGTRLGPQAEQHVEQTLRAAVADGNAAAAVQSGLLVRPLAASGFEPVDITDAVAVPLADVPRTTAGPEDGGEDEDAQAGGATAKSTRSAPSRASKAARERMRRAAREAVSAAEERVREADARVQSEDTRVRELAAAARELDAEQARLRERLTELAEELAGLDRDRRSAEHDRDRAERQAERAGLALERARKRQESTRVVE